MKYHVLKTRRKETIGMTPMRNVLNYNKNKLKKTYGRKYILIW